MRASWHALRALPTFWFGLALRLALLPIPASAITARLFAPFLDASVLQLGANPWASMHPKHFPYGSVLWAMLALPRWLVLTCLGPDALRTPWLSQALIKLPMLACDMALLLLLATLCGKRERQLTLVYWLNPVLLYATYVHGQLDVAVSLFALAALLALINDKIAVCGALWAAATLCKAHVVLAVPFVCAYLYKRYFLRAALAKMGLFAGVWIALTAVGLWPHVLAGSFAYVTAASPEALRLLGLRLQLGAGQHLYVGPAVALLLLGRLSIASSISDMGLVLGTGLMFGTLSLVTGGTAGWYFWSLPTICLFYVHYLLAPRSLLLGFNAIYLIYFALQDAHLLQGAPLVQGCLYTLLQTAFAGLLVAVWVLACRRETPLLRHGRPILLGIAGDSGTGKNMLSDAALALFARRRGALVEGDDYHRWERGNANWDAYTHLHPAANDLQGLASHTSALGAGQHVWQPHYDHATGTFTLPRQIGAPQVVVVQGLHALYLRHMREQFDVKVFLAPHELVQLAWKLQRDVRERGHSVDKVLQSFMRRRQDAQNHIRPQRALADWIIEMQPQQELTRDEVLGGASVRLRVKYTLWNDIPLLGLVEALQGQGVSARLQPGEDDIDRIHLWIDEAPSAQQVAAVAATAFRHLRRITRGSEPPVWQAGFSGTNQLILLSLLGQRGQDAAVFAAPRKFA